ncbi:hypothetical protein MRB53_037923 [Persea americana]|nr:hypothetical protein MRB53_037923 [Persea americana]
MQGGREYLHFATFLTTCALTTFTTYSAASSSTRRSSAGSMSMGKGLFTTRDINGLSLRIIGYCYYCGSMSSEEESTRCRSIHGPSMSDCLAGSALWKGNRIGVAACISISSSSILGRMAC